MSDDRLIWFKGALVPAREAVVPVLSPTAQFGLNAFEGLRAYWSVEQEDLLIFRLREHLTRLGRSCRLLGIVNPYSEAEIERAIREVIVANGFREDISARVTLFVDGVGGGWSAEKPVDMFVAPIRAPRRSQDDLSGKAACVSTWERINDRALPPRVKVGANYINGRYAHIEARRNGFDLPIMLGSNGKVSEGAGACLFLVRDGVLVTPTISSSILESITRDTVATLARAAGISVVEREVDRTELYVSDEVFLCGSAAEITPVLSVDHLVVGAGAPGPMTAQLLGLYHSAVTGKDARFPGWTTNLGLGAASDAQS